MRVPAAFCGILGFRPSHGAVPVVGVIPMAQSFDTVGKYPVICHIFFGRCRGLSGCYWHLYMCVSFESGISFSGP